MSPLIVTVRPMAELPRGVAGMARDAPIGAAATRGWFGCGAACNGTSPRLGVSISFSLYLLKRLIMSVLFGGIQLTEQADGQTSGRYTSQIHRVIKGGRVLEPAAIARSGRPTAPDPRAHTG